MISGGKTAMGLVLTAPLAACAAPVVQSTGAPVAVSRDLSVAAQSFVRDAGVASYYVSTCFGQGVAWKAGTSTETSKQFFDQLEAQGHTPEAINAAVAGINRADVETATARHLSQRGVSSDNVPAVCAAARGEIAEGTGAGRLMKAG